MLLGTLFFLGYFFYLAYSKQEEAFKADDDKNTIIQNSVNNNLNKIQDIFKKIELNDKSLNKIENLLKEFTKNKTNNTNNQSLELKINKLNDNLQKLTKDIENLKNQINQNKKVTKNQELKIDNINNSKKELVELIILKFDNNINFDNEIKYLEKISNKNDSYLFEQLNLVASKTYKGNEFLKDTFEKESIIFLRNKINKKGNRIINTFVLPYVDVKPSEANDLNDDELIHISEIDKLIKNKKYEKSFRKLKLIKNFDSFYFETYKQLKIVIEFTNLLKKVEKID